MMKKAEFENYISLGFFCEVAEDLEKMGLRNQSSPFDWGISDFSHVIEAIENKFNGFMEYDNLSQDRGFQSRYYDEKYCFWFFHDFNKYKSLEKQLPEVKAKYNRRINRFYKTIESPTLFFRYICSKYRDENNKSIELSWIEDNYEHMLSVLKVFNPKNDIVFIGDDSLKSDKIKIYYVKIDEGDIVSRSPIINNTELYDILSLVDFPGKKENIERYIRKQKKKNCCILRIKNLFKVVFKKLFCRVYVHSKISSISSI